MLSNKSCMRGKSCVSIGQPLFIIWIARFVMVTPAYNPLTREPICYTIISKMINVCLND